MSDASSYSVTARGDASKINAAIQRKGGFVEQHVKILAILNIVLGGFGILLALVILVFFGGLAAIAGADENPDAHGGAAILGIIGGIGFFVTAVISIPSVIAGFGLLKFRSWGHVLGIVLSVLNVINLMGFPITTALGIYGLWVLLNKETKPLFDPQASLV